MQVIFDRIIFARNDKYVRIDIHSQKRASCSKSVDILQQIVSTSQYQDVFALLATAYWQQVCCKLSTGLLQVDSENFLSTGLSLVFSTSCNKSANDKLQQACY